MKRLAKISNLTDPRMLGIYEQYKRACRFLQLSRRCKKSSSQFANLIAAVYPARAIVELMLGAAEKQELKNFKNKDIKRSYKDFEEKLTPKIPHYQLLEIIRIHDFHRFGCLPPDVTCKNVFIGGPIKLVANKGIAAISIATKEPQVIRTGHSFFKKQRPLYTVDGRFYSEEIGEYLPLDEILE